MTIDDTAVSEQNSGVANRLADHFGKNYGYLVPSGTAALEAALHGLGVRRGERVLLPSQSCPAVGVAAVRAGAHPVFVPANHGLTMDLTWIRRLAVTGREIVIVDHLYGMTVDVGYIRDELPSLRIIEDVSKAWGASWHGKPVGALGDLTVCSFGPKKPLDAGGGGGVFSADQRLASLFSSDDVEAGRTRTPWLPYLLPEWAGATIARALDIAAMRLQRRRRFAHRALQQVSELGLTCLEPQAGVEWAWNRVIARVPADLELTSAIQAIKHMGLKVRQPWPQPTWELPVFKAASTQSEGDDCAVLDRVLLIKVPQDAE